MAGRNEKAAGHMAAIVCNVLYGLNINVTKSLFTLSWMTPMGYSFIRISFGLLLFWTIGFFGRKEKIARGDLAIVLVAGFLGMVVTQLSYTVALNLISPVTISLLMASIPIAVLLLSIVFLKDRIDAKKAAGVIIGIVGAVIVVAQNKGGGQNGNSFLGILLTAISVLAQAVYFIIIRKIAHKYSSVTMIKWMFLLALLFLSPLCIPELPSQRLFSREAALLPMLQLGFGLVFGCAIPVFLLPVALKRLKATTASMYGNLQPLVASSAAIIAGQDLFSWDKPLALILIVLGIYFVTGKRTDGN